MEDASYNVLSVTGQNPVVDRAENLKEQTYYRRTGNGWSCPMLSDHVELAATEHAQRDARCGPGEVRQEAQWLIRWF